MDDSINAQLQAIGFARVLVSLQPQAASAIESQLASHFLVPDRGLQKQLSAQRVASAQLAHRSVRAKPGRSLPPLRVFQRLGLALGLVDRQGAETLQQDSRVRTMTLAPEISLIRPLAQRTAKAPSEITWGIRRLRVQELWNRGLTGSGVIVGHLDTGIDAEHPALQGALAAFAEFNLSGDQVKGAKPRDSESHGTHTAATIAGRPSTKGAVGVAPGAQLASAMVIEHGQVITRILGGMEWAVEQNARIVSASLGLRDYTPAFQELIDSLRRLDVLPVFAIGNDGPNTSRSPGNYHNVLSVGAFAEDGAVCNFSGSASFNRPVKPLVPDLVAPGADVLSAVPGGGYESWDGTSMAAPHIAGLAALLLQAQPGCSADELEKAIVASCRRPKGMPQPRANNGAPDAVRALEALTGRKIGRFAADSEPDARSPDSGLAGMLRRILDRAGFADGKPSGGDGGRARKHTARKPASRTAGPRKAASRKPAMKPVARKAAPRKAASRKPAVKKVAVRKAAKRRQGAAGRKPARGFANAPIAP